MPLALIFKFQTESQPELFFLLASSDKLKIFFFKKQQHNLNAKEWINEISEIMGSCNKSMMFKGQAIGKNIDNVSKCINIATKYAKRKLND